MSRMNTERLKDALRLYVVLGSTDCNDDPALVAEAAIRGGATLVQFREKGRDAKTGGEKEELAKRIQAVCRRYGIPFIVNDDVDLALAVDADGVHVGQEDESARSVRGRIGNQILGISVHSAEEALLAEEAGADYIGVGPIYPTVSKADARAARGTASIREIRAGHVMLPLVGIGGINRYCVQEVIQAGADGIAVISAVTAEADPQGAAQRLMQEVELAYCLLRKTGERR